MLQRLAGWCYDRRRLVLVLWVVALVGFTVLGKVAGGSLVKSFSSSGTDSSRAFTILGQDFQRSGDSGDVVWKSKTGSAISADVAHTITPLLEKLAKQPHVVSITSPFDKSNPQAAELVSHNPTSNIAHAQIQFNVKAGDVPLNEASHMRDLAKQANSKDLQVELGGQMFSSQEPPKSEVIGVIGAMFILLIAFGSLLAMGLPIGTALVGIGIGLALVEVLAHVLDVPSFAPQVTALIGIGVGIDYALFIVTRYREDLHDGRTPRDAVVHSVDTSGRAVLFAGCTVVISLLGLFIVGLSFIRGLATGAALAVLLVMFASVTLLPALLGFSGHAIDKWALKSARRRTSSTESGFWVRWAKTLQRYPWVALIAGLAILLALAIPALSLRLGSADAGNDPTNQTTRRAYDLLSEGFGKGSNGPLLVTARVSGPADMHTMQQVANKISALGPGGDVAQVSPVIPSPHGTAALVSVQPIGSPQDASTSDLIHHLRSTVIPSALDGSSIHVYVGGQTAAFSDIADQLGARLPWFFAAVLGLSFLLLMVVFRSILVPLKAVIMNLLSIAAAYGFLVAVFQWGWAKSVIGIGKPGPIESWAPMMLFAIVFGLSMDYEVFLLSRIKEEYDVTHNNADAVAHGLEKTGRLISAAAAIMICVFGAFVLSDMRVLKLIGLGLASAVFIDATIVRLILVPATMELLGDRNWWFPKALSFVPKINVEGAPATTTAHTQIDPAVESATVGR
jgi:RND superfamily putative drug exporter